MHPPTFGQRPSLFRASVGPAVNFRQLSVQPRDFPSTLCCLGTFRQLTSTFCTSCGALRELPPVLRMGQGLSDNFHQLSMQLRNISLTSVSFLCHRGAFHQISARPRDHPLTSFNTFVGTGHYVNLRQFSCGQETFRQILSSFCVARSPFVNFRKLSVQLGDLLSYSVNFPCGRETFSSLMSTFYLFDRPSIKFRQLSVRMDDLASTSIKFPQGRETHKLSIHQRNFLSTFFAVRGTFVNFLNSWETFR